MLLWHFSTMFTSGDAMMEHDAFRTLPGTLGSMMSWPQCEEDPLPKLLSFRATQNSCGTLTRKKDLLWRVFLGRPWLCECHVHPLDSVSTEKQPQLFPTEVEYLVLEAIQETKGLFSQVHLSWNKSIGVLLNLKWGSQWHHKGCHPIYFTGCKVRGTLCKSKHCWLYMILPSVNLKSINLKCNWCYVNFCVFLSLFVLC